MAARRVPTPETSVCCGQTVSSRSHCLGLLPRKLLPPVLASLTLVSGFRAILSSKH